MQLIVKLTNGCNLRCTYCSEGDFTQISILDKSLLLKIVDDVPELLETIKDDTIDFLWHGGEPLLYPKEALCEVMEYGLHKLSGK